MKMIAPSDPHYQLARDPAAEGSGTSAAALRSAEPHAGQSLEGGGVSTSEADVDQIVERLRWTPKQRLDYLLDMLAFEERARHARRAP